MALGLDCRRVTQRGDLLYRRSPGPVSSNPGFHYHGAALVVGNDLRCNLSAGGVYGVLSTSCEASGVIHPRPGSGVQILPRSDIWKPQISGGGLSFWRGVRAHRGKSFTQRPWHAFISRSMRIVFLGSIDCTASRIKHVFDMGLVLGLGLSLWCIHLLFLTRSV